MTSDNQPCHERNLNQAQRTRPLPSLRPKKCRLNLTTNQLKYLVLYGNYLGLGKVLEAHVALALRARAT